MPKFKLVRQVYEGNDAVQDGKTHLSFPNTDLGVAIASAGRLWRANNPFTAFDLSGLLGRKGAKAAA